MLSECGYRYPVLSVFVVVIFAGGFVAGCVQYRSEPLSAATEADSLATRTLSNPRLQKFIEVGLPPRRKSRTRTSWGLAELTLAALYYHPDLDVARAKLVSAQAGIVTAAQIPNPTLSGSVLYNSTTAIPSPWTAGQVVNFLIETLGKREHRTARARELAEAAREDLATATWQVRGRVRSALLNLWAAQRRLALIDRRLKLQQQFVTLLQRSFAEGQSSALDVSRERINLDQISLAVRDEERQRAEGRVQLATAIGVTVSALQNAVLSFDAFERPPRFRITIGNLRRQALLHRSDVQALLAEYEAAQSNLQLQVVQQFPNFTLGPGYTFDQGDNKYNLDLAIDLPILNQNQGPIAEAIARRKEAAARFVALQAQIIGSIDSALVSYRAATQAIATADELVASGRHREEEVSRLFAAGQVDRSTVLTAELEVAAIEVSRFEAVMRQRQSAGALEDALQYPVFEPGIKLFTWDTNPRASQPSR